MEHEESRSPGATGPVGLVGVGDMGLPMSGHLVRRGHDVVVYDLDEAKLAEAARAGGRPTGSVAEVATACSVVVACLRTDDQMADVAEQALAAGAGERILVVAGTHSLGLIRHLADRVTGTSLRLVDAPVVYGTTGAREGSLLSLAGGEATDVAHVTPVLMGYSRGVEHVGPLGSGQLAKACNNLLHWVHSVANFEALAIAKRFGVDAQRMREVLLQCPAENGTLRRWDGSRFTWQEKDMDFVTDLAQQGDLVLPLTGQVDQLVKTMSAADVAALLYEDECRYLGRTVSRLDPGEGGL